MMRFQQYHHLLLFQLLVLSTTTTTTTTITTAAAAVVVSSTSARLPMSLSTVIQDLEAEGCASHVTTAAFLTSRSVRGARCDSLLRSLFGLSTAADGDGNAKKKKTKTTTATGLLDDDDEDVEVEYGVTMAFGKKLIGGGGEDPPVDETNKKGKEEDDDHDGSSSSTTAGGGSGVAIACPPCGSSSRQYPSASRARRSGGQRPRAGGGGGASVGEICATVVACGGSIVYVADIVDLGRGEGLFHHLGPAIERLLAHRAAAREAVERVVGSSSSNSNNNHGPLHRPSTLIVVVDGIKDDDDDDERQRMMTMARKQWESAASLMLSSIIQPGGGSSSRSRPRATKLEDIFDRIEYLSPSAAANVERHLCPAGGTVSSPDSPSARGPSEVASSVSDAVHSGLVEDWGPVLRTSSSSSSSRAKQTSVRLANPTDLAAARVLGPAASAALRECLTSVRSATTTTGIDGSATTRLVPEFGALCDAGIRRALDTFDAAVADGAAAGFPKSAVTKRLRADLQENLYSEMGDIYESQVAALREHAFASFRAKLNKLRIGPNLPDRMKEVAERSLDEFAAAAKKLRRVSHATSYGSWMTNADQITGLKRQFAEHNAERLKAARASGQFPPVPRKGITLGFHWLLPKPFGNDYRQEPHLTHTADDLVYAPVDGITDVAAADIRSGDWRRGVVPAPSGGEMMYLK